MSNRFLASTLQRRSALMILGVVDALVENVLLVLLGILAIETSGRIFQAFLVHILRGLETQIFLINNR